MTVVLVDEGEQRIGESELDAEEGGYFSGVVEGAADGTRYKLQLDRGALVPDPVSRFQPAGPHGPSQLVDARRYAWGDGAWRGAGIHGQVIYELHVGSFTPAGTYRAAMAHLGHLREVGITVIEMMPVAEFPGTFGWGYDGVALFAPYHHYGAPDDLRAFVDAAHEQGIAVILDVVYNHLGPDGNYLKEFSERYFKGETEWGEALNFDGDQCGPVREFVLTNAGYWVDEFHFDGLRLDATQSIVDSSSPHIIAEVASRVRSAARGRETILVAENEPQDSRLVRPRDDGGFALDAMWNDDFHHSARVAATGRNEAYYSGFNGSAQELLSAAKYGFLYQGEWYGWQRGRRGQPALDLAPTQFVQFIQNHDQVANAATGQRLHELTSPGRHRALTALLLLIPQTPMLFMGQEFAASAPFLYFAEHNAELRRLVHRGRAEFLIQFPSIATTEMVQRIDDPSATATFMRCKLDWSERDRDMHAQTLALVRDLLRLRREDPTLHTHACGSADGPSGSARGARGRALDGAVLAEDAFVLRWFGETRADDRLLVVNLGKRLQRDPLAEPLVAPPATRVWRPLWSSEHLAYGGLGMPTVDADDGGWYVGAESAVLLHAVPREGAPAAHKLPQSEKEAREQWKEEHEKTAG